MTALANGLRVPVVLVVALVLQVVLMGDFRIAGATGDLLLLVGLAAAVAGGPQLGAITAFSAGILTDLTLTTPFGLSALAACLVAWAVGRLQTGIWRPVWWMSPATLGIASAAAVALYALLAAVVGNSGLLDRQSLVAMAVVGGLNAVMAPAAVRVMRWALRPVAEVRS